MCVCVFSNEKFNNVCIRVFSFVLESHAFRQRDPVRLGHQQSRFARLGRARQTAERRARRRHRVRVLEGHRVLRSERQGPERIGPRAPYAQADPQESRRLHQRPAIRDVRPVRRTVAHAARATVDHVADDRTDSVRQVVRHGAHRTAVAGNVARRSFGRCGCKCSPRQQEH